MSYPPVADLSLVGTYDALVSIGGGYVWDEVLEYRVWCHPEKGAPDLEDGNDYYYTFATGEAAEEFARSHPGTEEPLALILQREYLDEPEPGVYAHIVAERITEWHLDYLARPRRTAHTIPDFLAPDAPANRLAILRGEG